MEIKKKILVQVDDIVNFLIRSQGEVNYHGILSRDFY